MRVRMLNDPEIIRLINRETVAVTINATAGFPRSYPALAIVQRAIEHNPLLRLNFSIYLLIGPNGDKLYGASGCHYERILEGGADVAFTHLPAQLASEIARFERMQRLQEYPPVATIELAELDCGLGQHLEHTLLCLTETRLLTLFWLHDRHSLTWRSVMELLLDGEPAAGVRNAVVHALGDVLLEDRPYPPGAAEQIRMLFDAELRHLPPARVQAELDSWQQLGSEQGSAVVPPLLLRLAAQSLIELEGASIDRDAPDLVASARTWWRRHRDDDRFRILAGASDPAVGYRFLRTVGNAVPACAR